MISEATASNPDSLAERILLVAPEPVYEDRGTPIAIRQVLQALSELGYKVDLVTYPLGRDFSLPGLRWFRCGNPLRIKHVPVGFSLRKVVLDMSLAAELRRRVRGTTYRWIHAVEESAFLAVLAARSAGTPVLYDMQSSLPQQLASHPVLGTPPLQAFLSRAERWILRRASLVVASQGLGAYVEKMAPGCPCREWQFPSVTRAVDHDRTADLREELGLGDGVKIVVYSGTFAEYQGLPLLVEGARKVLEEEPGTVFVLVGGTPARVAQLRKLLASRGVLESFRIVPRQTQETARAYVELADVTVSPRAFGDNLPIKILDYMASGKPIVATAIPGHTTTLRESMAVLAEPSAEGLAAGILGLLREPGRARELGGAARDYADAHFGWQAFVDSTREYGREVSGETIETTGNGNRWQIDSP
ncbi:MAG: glycosyltransferase family 4 protein [Gemmatimonadota bacterium]